jgi:prepilin-type N-terminal cleavage/methylation domain-containing protein/prepilin-type processing-associated H-X9-DG protein
MKRIRSKRGERAAFTLVELLVVVAVIAILAALLLSAVVRAKGAARVAICLNNKKQLALTWALYPADNGGRLVPNAWPANWVPFVHPYPVAWTSSMLGWGATASDGSGSTNVEMLVGPTTSLFNPYLRDWRVYKCPADTFLSPAQRKAGWPARVRSVSMNMWMGGAYYHPLANADGQAGGDFRTAPGPTWYGTESQLLEPGPTELWVFIDEHPDSITGYQFIIRPTPPLATKIRWLGLPASYHSGGAGLAFADGHAQVKRWVVPSTKQPVTYKSEWWRRFAFQDNLETADFRDCQWLLEHATFIKETWQR